MNQPLFLNWIRHERTACGSAPPLILVADDEPTIRLGFRVALEAAGYGVSEVEDGGAVMESLRRDPADLVLLDLRMPGLDGMEVLRRLREEAIDVPVVVVSAYRSISSAARALELGADDILAKPVEPVRLRSTVREVLVRRADPRRGAGRQRPAQSSPAATAHPLADTLALARRTMELGHFDLADYLLQQAIDIDPASAEAHATRGRLLEIVGEDHGAYRCYRWALIHDPRHGTALDGLSRYCQRFGLDHHNPAINPAAGR
ncbi:MAG: response regulator [Isosphaeraceae bacterium]